MLDEHQGPLDHQTYPDAVVQGMPSTALLGNGDIGITSAGSPGVKTFLISKGTSGAATPARRRAGRRASP